MLPLPTFHKVRAFAHLGRCGRRRRPLSSAAEGIRLCAAIPGQPLPGLISPFRKSLGLFKVFRRNHDDDPGRPHAPKPARCASACAAHYRADETGIVEMLLGQAELPAEMQDRIAARARKLVEEVRRNRVGQGGIDAFMHAYELSSREGVVLMCLAEALLRIPDNETANQLIRDKLKDADFAAHLGESDSMFVNASTWALMLTGRIMQLDQTSSDLQGCPEAPGHAQRRAGHPPGGDAGDEDPRQAIRHGPRYRAKRPTAPNPPRSAAIAIPTTCWAKRPAP